MADRALVEAMNYISDEVLACSRYEFVDGRLNSDDITMTIVPADAGFMLSFGVISVSFANGFELLAMLPPFASENEIGYEDARASLIAQFNGRVGRV